MEAAQRLWDQLHACPELSGQERETRAALKAFLQENTTLALYEVAGGLIAAHREPTGPILAFRADMDAIPNSQGQPFHGCGHDGHCAILAALACLLEGRSLGKSILLLFQPAEETGQGAARLLEALLPRERINAIFGFHNIPGYPLGSVLLRQDIFACASEGVIFSLHGQQAHAAYPEQGANPIPVLAGLVYALPDLAAKAGGGAPLLATPTGFLAGGRNFGISPGDGELCLTLRAPRQADIVALEQAASSYLAAHAGLHLTMQRQDVFPETANTPHIFARVQACLREMGAPVLTLEKPMRWSEDFGWYLKKIPGLYMGFGAGEDCPGLHTDGYCFPSALISLCAQRLLDLAIRF